MSSKKSEAIWQKFIEKMEAEAGRRGVEFSLARFSHEATGTQQRRTCAIFKQENGQRKSPYGLYVKISSEQNPAYWWGLNPTITDWAKVLQGKGIPVGVVFLAGNEECGYFVPGKCLPTVLAKLSRQKKDGEYKVGERNLEGYGVVFRRTGQLYDILGINGEESGAPTDKGAG